MSVMFQRHSRFGESKKKKYRSILLICLSVELDGTNRIFRQNVHEKHMYPSTSGVRHEQCLAPTTDLCRLYQGFSNVSKYWDGYIYVYLEKTAFWREGVDTAIILGTCEEHYGRSILPRSMIGMNVKNQPFAPKKNYFSRTVDEAQAYICNALCRG